MLNIFKTTITGILLSCSVLSAIAADSRVHGVATVGGTLKSGNVNKFEAKASGQVYRTDTVFSFDVYGKFNYSETDHKGRDRGVTAYAKFDWYEFNRWSPFFAVEYLHNEYKGYNHKVSILAGEKFRIYQSRTSDYSISMAALYDNDEYVKDKVKTERENLFRLSLRPKIKQKLGDAVSLREQIYYQPRIDKFNDYIFKNLTSLEFKITTLIFLGIDFEYDYRSVVPTSIDSKGNVVTYDHDDIALDFSFRFKF
ncbi:MAG: DUF481 domain-containing protein [Paludibacteraceae bacterium]|nr:DUF481 domain-containing protein [Candidatus Physcocola equi]MCQ2235069.1 DUF481 domain-containing protein [Paludibacteraceae bacterium]